MDRYTRYVVALPLSVIIAIGTSVHAQVADPNPSTQFSLNAAGATFPFPLIDLWRVEYGKAYPNVSLNYQSIGSGGGIKQHIEGTVNFAASDAPMNSNEAALAPDTLHIPESIGAVVVAYNVPEIAESGLQLDGKTVSMMFLGEITMWNDERITSQNPGMDLPSAEIVTAHRSDGSGTTFVFTDYLSTVDDRFERDVGSGKSVPWPSGVAAAGNEGVAKIIQSTPYSIGYVELAYVHQTGMTFAYLRNGDDTAYVEPSISSIMAASSNIASQLPAARDSWEGVSIVNAPGPDSYPISSLTYLLVYGDLGRVADSISEAGAILHLIHWMLTEGQSYSESLLYVPLPAPISQIGIDGLASVTYNGNTVWGAPAEALEEMDTASTGGGCLIATAAFGTELAPQVQTLREVRDGVLLSTGVGTAFMSAFNSAYYSFSPTVADLETQSPELRGVIRVLIAPMLSLLSIMSYAEPGSDAHVLGFGIMVIALNVGLYVAAPASAAAYAWRHLRSVKRC